MIVWCPVPDLVIGDSYLWCGRAVTVVNWKPARTYSRWGSPRPSRRLIVTEGEGTHQLHYFDDERVAIVGEET